MFESEYEWDRSLVEDWESLEERSGEVRVWSPI